MIFRSDWHGVTFEKEIRLHKGCSNEFAAALFLLTADTRLWHQVEKHVGAKSIDVAAMKPRRLDGMSYMYFVVARDILTGNGAVNIPDLADRSLMSPRYFMVVSTALLIKGYGLSAADRLTFKTT